MKSIARVTNDAQIGKRLNIMHSKMMNENAHKETLSAGKDPMGLAASSILFVSCKEQRRIKLKCIWLKQRV